MYNYKGVLYTVDQIKEAAKQSNMSVDDYVKELKEQDPEPKTTEQMESTDLLDPNFQQDAAAGADVVSTNNSITSGVRGTKRYGITLGRYFFGFSKS